MNVFKLPVDVSIESTRFFVFNVVVAIDDERLPILELSPDVVVATLELNSPILVEILELNVE